MKSTAPPKSRFDAVVNTRIVANLPPHERAWWVLLGASLCMFSGQASVAYYTFGVFLPEIIADTHWRATAIAASIGVGAVVAAFVAPLVGMVSDRLGVRVVSMIGAPTFAAGFAILGLFPTSAGSFVVAMIVLWMLVFAGSPVPYAQMLSGWFDRRRGTALGIMFAAGSVGIAFWPPYSAFLIKHLGWREAYTVIGVSGALILFVSAVLLLRNPPRHADALPSVSTSHSGLLAREALKTPRFWKIATTFLLLTAILGGAAVTFPLVLRQQGADPQTAASIMSVIGAAMFFGRLLLGFALDRFFAPYVTIAITVVPMLGFGLVIALPSQPTLIFAAACLGFGLGSEYAVTAYMVSRSFGVRAYGAIYGIVTIATSLGAAIGPAAFGAAIVSSFSIHALFGAAALLLLFPIAILMTLKPSDLPFHREESGLRSDTQSTPA